MRSLGLIEIGLGLITSLGMERKQDCNQNRTSIMKNEILPNLNNPEQLEKLYSADKPGFKQAFKSHLDALEQLILSNRKDS